MKSYGDDSLTLYQLPLPVLLRLLLVLLPRCNNKWILNVYQFDRMEQLRASIHNGKASKYIDGIYFLF